MSKKINLNQTVRYTLIADGISDTVLIPIIEWLLRQYGIAPTNQGSNILGSGALLEKIQTAIEVDQFDLLFIHRDAERESREKRLQEITEVLKNISFCPPTVPIIPVRMTEAWLLFDGEALRRAVGNDSGKTTLSLPPIKKLEDLPDPKQKLFELLEAAHNPKTKRKRQEAKKRRFADRHEVARQIDDFSPLRQLSAFRSLEQDLCSVLGLEYKGR
ncbi:MAG: hypothetical protein AAGG51_18695 [Cyanobacteria bacterium P01_G01_bin.54]